VPVGIVVEVRGDGDTRAMSMYAKAATTLTKEHRSSARERVTLWRITCPRRWCDRLP
jgi:hypothetical protein